MTENKKQKGPFSDIIPLAIGEIIVAALVCVGFIAVDMLTKYEISYIQVILGAILGAAVIIGNHAWLTLTVDGEIKKYLQKRGSKEMSEEEADAFTKQHTASIQKAISLSSIVRTVSIFAVLILAFITKWFNPLATAIPMFAMRFVIMATEMIRSKNNPKPDPSKFIRYDDEDKNTDEEKEDK